MEEETSLEKRVRIGFCLTIGALAVAAGAYISRQEEQPERVPVYRQEAQVQVEKKQEYSSVPEYGVSDAGPAEEEDCAEINRAMDELSKTQD